MWVMYCYSLCAILLPYQMFTCVFVITFHDYELPELLEYEMRYMNEE